MKNIKDVEASITTWLGKTKKIKNSIVSCTVDQFLTSIVMKQTKVLLHNKMSSTDQKVKFPMWITGPSGFGKSWLAGQLEGRFSFMKFGNLDSHADHKGSKWLVDWSKLKNKDVYYGQADNTTEFSRSVRSIVVPLPSFDSLRLILDAKIRSTKKRHPGPSGKYRIGIYQKLIEMTDAQLGKWYFDHLRQILTRLVPDQDVYLVETPIVSQVPAKGWFEFS